mmetsp:Transcript_15515/g.52313  ORF Transcript_15515/g.52313 Transcript_15515/m.52313 type:complete len:267 (+) Transcript_15515:1730-2530(+)
MSSAKTPFAPTRSISNSQFTPTSWCSRKRKEAAQTEFTSAIVAGLKAPASRGAPLPSMASMDAADKAWAPSSPAEMDLRNSSINLSENSAHFAKVCSASTASSASSSSSSKFSTNSTAAAATAAAASAAAAEAGSALRSDLCRARSDRAGRPFGGAFFFGFGRNPSSSSSSPEIMSSSASSSSDSSSGSSSLSQSFFRFFLPALPLPLSGVFFDALAKAAMFFFFEGSSVTRWNHPPESSRCGAGCAGCDGCCGACWSIFCIWCIC